MNTDTNIKIVFDDALLQFIEKGELGIWVITWVLRMDGREDRTQIQSGLIVAVDEEQMLGEVLSWKGRIEEEGNVKVLHVSRKRFWEMFAKLEQELRAYDVLYQFDENVDKGKVEK